VETGRQAFESHLNWDAWGRFMQRVTARCAENVSYGRIIALRMAKSVPTGHWWNRCPHARRTAAKDVVSSGEIERFRASKVVAHYRSF
jgi:hypothetical protein